MGGNDLVLSVEKSPCAGKEAAESEISVRSWHQIREQFMPVTARQAMTACNIVR
jgi:hypothetical protein